LHPRTLGRRVANTDPIDAAHAHRVSVDRTERAASLDVLETGHPALARRAAQRPPDTTRALILQRTGEPTQIAFMAIVIRMRIQDGQLPRRHGAVCVYDHGPDGRCGADIVDRGHIDTHLASVITPENQGAVMRERRGS